MNISSVHPRKTMISKKEEVICTNVHIHVGEKMLYIVTHLLMPFTAAS